MSADELRRARAEEYQQRRIRRGWEAALGGRSGLVSPIDRSSTVGGAPQTPIAVGGSDDGELLLVTALAQAIASGGDYVDADAITYQYGFAAVTLPGDSIIWPFDAVGAIQIEWEWASYTGAVGFEIEVDGVVPPWGTMLAASGASGFRRRGVHIAQGAMVKLLVTQTSGSPQTGDFVVEFQVQGPTSGVVEDAPPPCLSDGFSTGWPVGEPTPTSINGRVTEAGGGLWVQEDGTTIAPNVPGQVAGVDPTMPPPAGSGWPAAFVNCGFSDGVIHADVNPIAENNSPAFRNGIIFRYVDPGNFWAWANYQSPVSGSGYFLQSYVGGVLDYDSGLLTTGARNTGGLIPLEVIISGDSIDCYYDGVLRHSITDSAHQTATRHGVTTFGYGVDYWSACPSDEIEIPAPYVWYVGEDLAEDLSDGDPVTSWVDRTGNGFDVTVPAGHGAPTFRAADLNGLGTVEFDPTSDDALKVPTGCDLATHGPTNEWTVFAVFLTHNAGAQQELVNGDDQTSSGGNIRGPVFMYVTSAGVLSMIDEGSTTVESSGQTVTADVWYMGESWRSSTQMEALLDDVGNGPTTIALSGTAEPNLFLGYHPATGGADLDGKLAEVIGWDRLLTGLETALVRSYLAAKYGL